MNKLCSKAVLLATLMATASYTSVALAKKTPGSLGTKATAVDLYKSTCSKTAAGSTASFVASVKALTKGPLVSIQIKKGNKVVKVTDAKNGDLKYSPDAIIKGGGEGVYTLSVDKRGAGVVNYTIESFCKTAAGKNSGQLGPIPTQNQ